MPHTKQLSTTPLRISEDLKIWLKARANTNFRSVNAEIIAMLVEERRKEEECFKARKEPAQQ
ncbi:MAG: Arc family DNA-binding protein [Noviherbaspirillum sp.]